MIEGWDTAVTYVLTPPQVHWSFLGPLRIWLRMGVWKLWVGYSTLQIDQSDILVKQGSVDRALFAIFYRRRALASGMLSPLED